MQDKGSPNNLGAGYLLIQHKRQLGWKYISKIRVFESGDDYRFIQFCFSDNAPREGLVDTVEQRLEDAHSTSRRRRDQSKAKAHARAMTP